MSTAFDAKVQEQIERLEMKSLEAIQAEVSAKRRAWIRQNRAELVGKAITPRQAYELLFFDYMGLSSDDLPVESETAEKITWRSLNACPTLAACEQLGLDTRKVCRDAYEGSTQAFLSELDPALRFGRSYAVIRPYAGYCLEWIERIEG